MEKEDIKNLYLNKIGEQLNRLFFKVQKTKF